MMTGTDDPMTDLAAFQALLDADRKQLIDSLLQQLDQYSEPLDRIDEDERTTGALLALIAELSQEVEDLRNQLELQQIRNGQKTGGPARPAAREGPVREDTHGLGDRAGVP